MQIFNFNSEEFVTVDVSMASFNVDAVFTYDFSGGMLQYLGDSDEVKAQMSWKQAGFIINYPWEVRVDKFGWQIAE